MMARLKEINTALPGLLLGIFLFGVLCQAAGLFFVPDKADYSIGLWAGVLTAVFMAFHMAVSLNSAVERDEKGARAGATRQYLIRYCIIVLILAALMVTGAGSPLAAFLGIMGLKVSAYMQPALARLFHRSTHSDAPKA